MEAKFKDDPKTKLGGITDIPETIIPSTNNNNDGMYVCMDGCILFFLFGLHAALQKLQSN